ncbi:acyl-CoA dehydrogenase family protein [Amycolatopsis jejuensis]|uniref:acyl-CoA dehydrogenase family protein n=1 Tax=Amycolatopsis jejuensis TaxID=330084 RepID=UPI00068D01C0|nr:acyl-CoA dehydrogenase [Amycolatopsis jejuensis]
MTTGAAVAAVQRILGDPWAADNPLGLAACLAADERAELPPSGVAAMAEFGLTAEFVPAHHGGRLRNLARTIEVLRAVYRRDPALGLGCGAGPLVAAANVWTAGSPQQCARTAKLLLAGGTLAGGSDLTDHGLSAVRSGNSLVLNGVNDIVANIEHADAMVVSARTMDTPGTRPYRQLLLHRGELAADRVHDLPRHATVGMRGVSLGGIRFTECPVPAASPLGGLGDGQRSCQVIRVALPGMMIGILDTALRLAVRHARRRILYGASLAGMPRAEAILSGAFADLLCCDAFCGAAAEALVRFPGSANRYAAAVKFLVPRMLIDATTELSALLGAAFYVRDGETGYFQKLVRDVRAAGLGHEPAISAQLTLLTCLPRSARSGIPAPDELFRSGSDELDFGRLTLQPDDDDPLIGTLLTAVDRIPRDARELRALAAWFGDQVDALAADCRTLPPNEPGITAGPAALALTTRYALALGAAACLGRWLADGGDPAWPLLALARLARRFTGRLPDLPGLPAAVAAARSQLGTDAAERADQDMTFDLACRDLRSMA